MRTLILFLALTLPLAAQEPKTVKLTLSPETTYLTEPQLPDGRIDYLAALNKMLSAKTTPENNLVVGLIPLVKDDLESAVNYMLSLSSEAEEEKTKQEALRKYREQFYTMIGLDTPPSMESLVDLAPMSARYVQGLEVNYENELRKCYSQDELAEMIHKKREEQKNDYKTRLNDGGISKEEYEEEIQKIESDTQYVCWSIIYDQWYQALIQPWTAKDFPYLAKWMESMKELAPKLITLSKERTGYYHPQISESSLGYDMLLPYVQTLRLCARFLQVRGNYEFAKGNYDEAMECSFTAIRLGQTLRKNACLLEDLVGVSMIGLGTYQLSKHLTVLSGKKDAAWILQKKQEYDALCNIIPLLRRGAQRAGWSNNQAPLYFQQDHPYPSEGGELKTSVPMWYLHERLMVLNVMQAAAVNHQQLNAYFKIMFDDDDTFARYEKLFCSGIAYDWDEILRRLNHFYDDMADISLLPDWKRRLWAASRLHRRIVEHDERSKKPSGKPEQQAVDFLVGTLAPIIEQMTIAQTRCEWGQSITSVAFALSAYRADNGGESPDLLEQLVPKYLPLVPMSQFTNKPLRYIKREHEVLIASDDEYKLNGSEEEVEKKIAEAKPGEWAYPAHDHYVFVVSKD